MSRIKNKFEELNGKSAFIGYITAGDPSIESGSTVSKTKNSFVIVEANKGKYYALPIYQSTVDNSSHTTNKTFAKQLTKYLVDNTETLITTSDKAERDEIWKNLSKYIRLTNKNTTNDFSFKLYYKHNNSDNSNIVFTVYERDGAMSYKTYYKLEYAGNGNYNVYKTQNVNDKGAPAFVKY